MKRCDINADDLLARYRAGTSVNQLARELGVSRSPISRVLRERGEHLRGRSQAELFKWAAMTAADRGRQVAAAHLATRGRTLSLAERLLRAAITERRVLHTSAYERDLAAMLERRHVTVVPQKAIGPYNCDLAVGSIAVEVWAGNRNGGSRDPRRAVKRLRYFLDQGWHVLAVKVNRAGRYAMTDKTADYVADFVDHLRRYPPARCEYRVVGGNGETLAAGGPENAEVAFIHPFRLARDLRTGRYERASG